MRSDAKLNWSALILSTGQYFGDEALLNEKQRSCRKDDVDDPSLWRGNRIKLSHRSIFSGNGQAIRTTNSDVTVCLSSWIYVTRDWSLVGGFSKQRVILFKGPVCGLHGAKLYLDSCSNHLLFSLMLPMDDDDDDDNHKPIHVTVRSNVEIPLYRWVHVSVTISSQRMALFVNGAECGSCDGQMSQDCFTQFLSNQWPVYIGSDSRFDHCFVGCLQDVRWSELSLASSANRESDDETDSMENVVRSLMTDNAPTYPQDGAFDAETHVLSRYWSSIDQLNAWRPGIDPMNRASVPLVDRPQSSSSSRKVIHCHDMNGGYWDDSMVQGGYRTCVYNFTRWQYIDYFIYFSHERVTIPPATWINACHRNGVKCIGTFITEWDLGLKETVYMLDSDPDSSFGRKYADKLIEMAEYYGFDGWFFNIENTLPDPVYVQKVIQFLEYMTTEMHRRLPGSLVIWYDSVTTDGELKWQNALNLKNKPFFDVCDAIFLNYCWNPDGLLSSAEYAKERNRDVFAGIDIFGRNTFGGGGWTTSLALKEIERCDLSVALFAPGWTFESVCNQSDSGDSTSRRLMFEDNESRFWNGVHHYQMLKCGSGEVGWREHWTVEDGGSGWIVDGDGFQDKCFVTSHQPCTKYQTIDLSEHQSLIPTSGPFTFRFGVWHRGTGPNFSDTVFLEVTLLAKDGSTVLQHYSSGNVTCTDQWTLLSGAFTLQGQDTDNVGFVVFKDGGRDAEYWAGNYGSRLSNAYVTVETTEEAIDTYIEEKPIVTPVQPFVSHFNSGIGQRYFIEGIEHTYRNWCNLSDQSVLPTYWNSARAFVHGQLSVTFNYSDAYCGGSSLRFASTSDLTMVSPGSFVIYKLFRTVLDIHRDGCRLTLTTKERITGSKIALVLYTENSEGRGHCLVPTTCSILSSSSIDNVTMHAVESTVSNVNGWNRESFPVPRALIGSRIHHIALCCYSAGESDDDGYELLLGQFLIDYSRGEQEQPQHDSSGQYSLTWLPHSLNEPNDSLICHVNLSWNMDICQHDNAACHRILSYFVYQDGVLIGRSFSTQYRVDFVKGLEQRAQPLIYTIVPMNETTGVILKERTIEIEIRLPVSTN